MKKEWNKVKIQTDKRKKDSRESERNNETEGSPEYKARLPRIRFIAMTYHLLVSMTAAVTFGKWLYLVHDPATTPMGDKINIPQQQCTDTHTHNFSIDSHTLRAVWRDNIHQSSSEQYLLPQFYRLTPQTGRMCAVEHWDIIIQEMVPLTMLGWERGRRQRCEEQGETWFNLSYGDHREGFHKMERLYLACRIALVCSSR